MKCNYCWKSLHDDPEKVGYLAQCSHVFCVRCAQRHFEASASCPICDQTLGSNGIRVIELDASPERLLSLCGCSPMFCLEAASKGIELWTFQKSLELGFVEKERSAISNKASEYQKLANEASEQLNYLKSKVGDLERERSRIRSELEELRSNYDEKTRQKRKLEELYTGLKETNIEPTSRPRPFGLGILPPRPTIRTPFNSENRQNTLEPPRAPPPSLASSRVTSPAPNQQSQVLSPFLQRRSGSLGSPSPSNTSRTMSPSPKSTSQSFDRFAAAREMTHRAPSGQPMFGGAGSSSANPPRPRTFNPPPTLQRPTTPLLARRTMQQRGITSSI